MKTDGEIAAYAAGIIDGEGTITICKAIPRKVYHYIPHISVSNTDEKIVMWMQENFGGSIRKIEDNRPNRKNSYQWGIFGVKAGEEFLQKIYKYLIIKKERASLLLYFLSSKDWVDDNYTIHLVDKEKFYLQMKELNKKGKKDENQVDE